MRFAGSLQEAARVKREELEIAQAYSDAVIHGRELGWDIAYSLSDLSSIEAGLGNLDEARRLSQEAVAIWRERNDPLGLAHSLNHAVDVALALDDVARAQELAVEAVEFAKRSEEIPSDDFALAYVSLAECELRLGRTSSAMRQTVTAIEIARRTLAANAASGAVRLASLLALARDEPGLAARLSAAFASMLQMSGTVLENDPRWHSSFQAVTEELRARLAPEEYADEWVLGARLDPGEALDLAHQTLVLWLESSDAH